MKVFDKLSKVTLVYKVIISVSNLYSNIYNTSNFKYSFVAKKKKKRTTGMYVWFKLPNNLVKNWLTTLCLYLQQWMGKQN